MSTLAAATVVSKSHLGYARVLARSLRRIEPAVPTFVLLLDRADERFDPAFEPFEVIELAELDIPDLARFTFQYTAFELSCAVKPFLLRHLLERRGLEKVLYVDSDVFVYEPLVPLDRLLDVRSILLTPHLLNGDPTGRTKGFERAMLPSGSFNGGFVGVRRDENARSFLDWWADRVYDGCIAEPASGFFVDQRWLDLVPGMFDGVHVVRHPGCNVGHWALGNRAITDDGGRLLVDGEPLLFFHFSGLDLENLDRVCVHRTDLSLRNHEPLRPLFERYAEALVAAGHLETRTWPYSFGRFDNDVWIPPLARRIYWKLGARGARFGDPFATAHVGSFWEWLNEEVNPGSGVSRFWYQIYLSRSDLQVTFPEVFGPPGVVTSPGATAASTLERRQPQDFAEWIAQWGMHEYQFGSFIPPRPRSLAGPLAPRPTAAPTEGVPAVNVIGAVNSEKGIGEALRATVRALSAAGVPHAVVDFPDPGSTGGDDTLLAELVHNPNPVNVLHVNADAMPWFMRSRRVEFNRGHYNVGFWMWELPDFPPVYHAAFGYVDEVWAPSAFCLEALSKVSPVPVVRMPLALSPERKQTANLTRQDFRLPEESVIFLFVFDVASVLARKNPQGLIEAFHRAFPGGEDVRLVLKVAHGARVRQALVDEAADQRIIVAEGVFSRTQLRSLHAVCDCYVSLHRSEGFGMTIAEAMALGKPVIATAFSGNLDFMTERNSFLVPCDLVRLDRDHPPYQKGSFWAEPDLDRAAEAMRFVYEHREAAADRGWRAARDVWKLLSPGAVGEQMRRRLEVIGRRIT